MSPDDAVRLSLVIAGASTTFTFFCTREVITRQRKYADDMRDIVVGGIEAIHDAHMDSMKSVVSTARDAYNRLAKDAFAVRESGTTLRDSAD